MTGHLFDAAWKPLLSAVLLGAAFLVPTFNPRWPPWMRVAWRAAAFAVLTWLVHRAVGSPLQPAFRNDAASGQEWEHVLEAAWWLTGAWVAVGASRWLALLGKRSRHAKIASDLAAGTICIATVLAVVNFVFAIPVAGLLATSGVVAIVLGLALQSTLSDVFSGVAIGLERPYGIGDLIWIEGGIEGRVLQIDWRSTQVMTGHSNVAVVPNSVIAKARLVNRNAPTSLRGDTAELRLDPQAPVALCIETLTAAVQACCSCLEAPAPNVSCTGMHGDGATYEIAYSVASSEQLPEARSELFAQVQRHLRHAGIGLAVAGRTPQRQVPAPTARELLGGTGVFGRLGPTQLDALAAQLAAVRLRPGDALFQEGEEPERIFVLAAGTVEVTVGGLAPRPTGRLGPGETLGVREMLTGALLGGTATALTPVEAYAIERAAFEATSKAMPDLASRLCLPAQPDRDHRLAAGSMPMGADVGARETGSLLARLQALMHRTPGGDGAHARYG